MFAKKPKGVKKNTSKRSGLPAWFWMLLGSFLTLGMGLFLYLWNPLKQQHSPITEVTSEVEAQADEPQGDNENTAEKLNRKAGKSGSQAKSEYEFYDLLPDQKVIPVPDEAIITKENKNKQVDADVTLELPTEAFDDDENYSPQANDRAAQNENDSTWALVEDTKPSGSAADKSDIKPNITHSQNDLPAPVSDDTNYDTYDGSVPVTAASNQPATQENKSGSDPISEKIAELSKPSYILQINSYNNAADADKRRAEVLLAGVDARVVERTGLDGQRLFQVITKPYGSKTQAFTALDRLQVSGIDALVVERKN